MSEIRFGVTYPAGLQVDCDLKTYVEEVEGLGYDSMWLIENVGSNTPGFECLTTLGYMAALTERLVLGTSVLLLPLRNPVLLAQAINTLDQLSNGRIVLGVGVGDPGSHTALGSDRRSRGARCEEYLQLLHELWTEDDVSFCGEFQKTDGYTLRPRSIQSPHVPVWVGGHSRAAAARAARLADGFIPVGEVPSACASLFEEIDRGACALGRPPVTRAVHAYLGLASSAEVALEVASQTLTERFQADVTITDSSPHFLGTPQRCREQIAAFVEAGITHFIFDPVCRTGETQAQVRRFAAEVLDGCR